MGKTFKDKRKKKHQVEVIEQFFDKLAALCKISKGLTKFSHTAINPHQIHLARHLQYVSLLAMAALPCNGLLLTLPVKTFDNLSKLYDL